MRVKKFDYKEVFDKYTENLKLIQIDILHLYDTKKECLRKNDGFQDVRHFSLWGFNTMTMEKVNLGKHDGIINMSDVNFHSVKVYADGSFMIKMKQLVSISNVQCLMLENIKNI